MSLRKRVNSELRKLAQRDDINYQFMQEATGINARTFQRLFNKQTKRIHLDVICKLEEAGLINLNIDGKEFNKDDAPKWSESKPLTNHSEFNQKRRQERIASIKSIPKLVTHVVSLIDFEDNVTKGKQYKTLSTTDNETAVIIDEQGARFELLKDEYKPLN